jgi:hypothetical protein
MNDDPASNAPRPAITDSPWFWAMAFCAASLVFLLVISPRYAARQRRLEMQYQAHQERYRRQVEGEPAAQGEGQEGTAAPPAPGELIIPLWPLLGLFAVLLAFTGAMLRRERRALLGPGGASASGEPP